MNTKKLLWIIIIGLFSVNANSQVQTSFYDFKVNTIDGKTFDFNSLRGKKVLIVNVASKCGNTPQYTDLEKLYKQYKDKNFVILGFPSNSFLQETGSNDEIRKFCSVNYGVTFPMMSKISVKGENIHPLYQWLTIKEKNGLQDSYVKWNFQKYLVDENGKLSKVIDPKVNPFDKEIISWINDHSEKK